MGYSFYIYAPKNDPILRKRWRDRIPEDLVRKLKELAHFCQDHRMQLSFGISPLGINYDSNEDRERFITKTLHLQEIMSSNTVCVFFDDIKAECATLGTKQGELIAKLHQRLPIDTRLICCPTFYSFDPVLEKIFGTRPQEYFEDLGRTLPEDTLLCWTGNKVISKDITKEDLKKASAMLRRPLCLWDNYPVNDGRKLSNHIFLSPYEGRTDLNGCCLMHAVNPMTEAALSTVTLSSLPLIYQHCDQKKLFDAMFHELEILFQEHALKMLEDLMQCEKEGSQALPKACVERLLSHCTALGPQFLGAHELKDFLLGKYAFDPQCLTS